jgi:hypothetical protein
MTVLVVGVAHGQLTEIRAYRDLPSKADLDGFNKRIESAPTPLDPARLYDEIQRLEFMRQALDQLRNEPSPVEPIKQQLETTFDETARSTGDRNT